MASTDRSKHLLSKAALPKVVVPKRDAAPKREFATPRMDSNTDGNPAAAAEEPANDDTKSAKADTKVDPVMAAMDKKLGLSGKHGDRTLDWFRTGDALADMPEGDVAQAQQPRAPSIVEEPQYEDEVVATTNDTRIKAIIAAAFVATGVALFLLTIG